MRALLVTHGDLGAALLRSAGTVYAIPAPLQSIDNEELDLPSLTSAIAGWLDAESGDAIVMVDVGGGSCGTAARAAAHGRSGVRVLAGVNLPMVLTFVSSHAQLGLDDLVSKMLDRALNAVSSLELP